MMRETSHVRLGPDLREQRGRVWAALSSGLDMHKTLYQRGGGGSHEVRERDLPCQRGKKARRGNQQQSQELTLEEEEF